MLRLRAMWRQTEDRLAVVPLLLDDCLFHAARWDGNEAAARAGELADIADEAPLLVVAAALVHARRPSD